MNSVIDEEIIQNHNQAEAFISLFLFIFYKMGIGDWGLGIGDWGLGPIPNPQSPIPNPHFIPNFKIFLIFLIIS